MTEAVEKEQVAAPAAPAEAPASVKETMKGPNNGAKSDAEPESAAPPAGAAEPCEPESKKTEDSGAEEEPVKKTSSKEPKKPAAKKESAAKKAAPKPKAEAPVQRRESGRERKQVQLVNMGSQRAKLTPEAIEGDGTKLRDIEYVKFKFDSHTLDDDVIKLLHRTIFGSDGVRAKRKRDLLDFQGFKGLVDEETQWFVDRAKRHLESYKLQHLHEALDIMGLPRGSGDEGTKEAKVERLLEFLRLPADAGKKVPAATTKAKAAPASKKKAKPAKRTSAGSKKKKTKTEHEGESEEEEDDEDEADEEEEDEEEKEEAPPKPKKTKTTTAAKPKAAKKKAASDDEADDDEAGGDEDEKVEDEEKEEETKEEEKKKPAAKKATKRTAAGKEKAAAKEGKDADAEEDDEGSSPKKKGKKGPGREATKPKTLVDDDMDEDVPEPPSLPSDDEIKEAVLEVMRSQNNEQVSIKDVIESIMKNRGYSKAVVKAHKPLIRSTALDYLEAQTSGKADAEPSEAGGTNGATASGDDADKGASEAKGAVQDAPMATDAAAEPAAAEPVAEAATA